MLVELVYSTKIMNGVNVTISDARAAATAVNSIAGSLESFAADSGLGSEYDITYFSDLASFASSLAERCTTNAQAVMTYLDSLEEIDSRKLNGNGSGSPGGGTGGVAPVGVGTAIKTGDIEQPENMSDESYKKTLDTIDKAKDMTKAKKMSEKSYAKTMDAITFLASLVGAKKLSDEKYAASIGTIDKLMDLLNAGKMSDEEYAASLDTIKKAANLLNAGKMSEEQYAKTVENIDKAAEALEAGKMSEEEYAHTVDSIDKTMNVLTVGKMSEETYAKSMDTIGGMLDLVNAGQMSNETYASSLGTYDNLLKCLSTKRMDEAAYSATLDQISGALEQLKAGTMSESSYSSVMSNINKALEALNGRQMSLDDYNNYVSAVNKALEQLKAGEITEDEFNKIIADAYPVSETPASEPGTDTGIGAQPGGDEGGKDPTGGSDQPTSEQEGSSLGGGIPGLPGTGDGSGLGGAVGAGGASGLSTVAAAAQEGLAAVKDVTSGVVDAIGKGVAKLASGVSPYSGSATDTINTNKASAGIIAAASLVAGGAAAGGGIIAGKKLSVIRFTPEDWAAIGEDYQSIIIKLMKKVGFSNDEIETFKNSKFKIATSELREHSKKIDKALLEGVSCDEELFKLYGYSMFDENKKIIDYLLFVTMIIDGKNSIDEYNMYNVINQCFESVDDADFVYAGIAMDDYFDDSNEEEDEIQFANNPMDQSFGADDGTEGGLEEASSPLLDKEWLQDIGIEK